VQYLGGKSRIAKRVAASVNEIRRGRLVWEPFCGGLSVSVALGGRVLCTDAHPALIALYQAVAAGWDPPATLTEDEYRAARTLPDSDPRKAFAGFGCSFGGKWFGGYARANESHPKGYAEISRRRILSNVGELVTRGCEFACLDFLAVEPHPIDALIYCDPPYAGTTGYAMTFDVERFRDRVAAWSAFTDVVVSEYAMPWGRVCWEQPVRMSVAGGGQSAMGARTERLYRYGPDRILDRVRI